MTGCTVIAKCMFVALCICIYVFIEGLMEHVSYVCANIVTLKLYIYIYIHTLLTNLLTYYQIKEKAS